MYTKKNWYCHATCGHEHEHFHFTKATASVPMDVSQVSSNVPKTEAMEQESDFNQYEQGQECEGDELFAVKGKGTGG